MRKFLSRLFYFSFTFVAFYPIIILLFGYLQPSWIKSNLNYKFGATGHLFSRIKDIDNYHNIDILFLGSSHTYRGFDTRIFSNSGFKTFNLGSSAQTPIQTNLLLDRYLEKLNPKFIIYEVYPETFSLDGVESALDIISNDENDAKSLEMVLNLNNVKVYNTFMYSNVRELLNLNINQSEHIEKYNDIYINGGFVERKNEKVKLNNLPAKIITIKDEQIIIFNKILKKFINKKIPFLLVYAPVTKKYYKSIVNGDSIDILFTKNWPYINFNDGDYLNDSLHFFDKDHLNQDGVTLFNKKLIDYLDKNRYLDNIKN